MEATTMLATTNANNAAVEEGRAIPLVRVRLDSVDVLRGVIMILMTLDHTRDFLLAVVRLGENAYGRAILKEVQTRLERDVAAGAVHATLERLERKRVVSSRLGPGTPVRGGRARRFYHLQPKGVRALNDARAAIDSLWQGLKWPLKGCV